MSYSVSPASSSACARRLAIGFACAFVAGASLAEPAASQAVAEDAVRTESREGVVLEVDGVTLARFTEVSGLNTAARTKWANITLKRGVTEGPALRRWHEAGRTRGSDARRNGSIILYDSHGRPVARWHFENAWPKGYDRRAREAGAGEALATVTLEVESIRREAP